MESEARQINDLPREVLCKIFSFLESEQRWKASLVCSTWYNVAQDPQFLRQACICLSSAERNWRILDRICKRRIPNLRINFIPGEGGRVKYISPEIAHQSEFVSDVKYLCLTGFLAASDVIFCLRHFKNIQTLRIAPLCFQLYEFFEDEDLCDRETLTEALTHLPNLVFEMAFNSDGLGEADLFRCFAGVERLSITSRGEALDYLSLPSLGEVSYSTLASGGMIQRIQELDLRCFYMVHEHFKELVNTPGLQLRTLRFSSCDGGGCNLRILADANLSLEIIEVVCQCDETVAIRYPGILNLLTRTPSVKNSECAGMLYTPCECWDTGEQYGDTFGSIVEEWPNLDQLNVIEVSPDEHHEFDLAFSFKRKLKSLEMHHASSAFDHVTLSPLAQCSPGLRAFNLQTAQGIIYKLNSIDMSTLVNSFPDMTRLTLFDCDLSGIDLSALGPSPICKLKNLEILGLAHCKGVSDDDLVVLHFANIKHLLLTDCEDITDRAVISIAGSNPTLQLLCLDGCSQISGRGFAAIASHLEHLRCIFLVNCHRIPAESAEGLSGKLQMLQMIDVTGCDPSFICALERQRLSFRYLGLIEIKTSSGVRRVLDTSDPTRSYEYDGR